MLGVSTAWNADRLGGWEPAVREWIELQQAHVLLDGPTLYADAAAAGRSARRSKGTVLGLVVPLPVGLERGPVRSGGLSAPAASVRQEAVRRVLRGFELALAARTGVVVLPVGGPDDIPGSTVDTWRQGLRRDGPTPELRTGLVDLLEQESPLRQTRLEALCRSLHELTGRCPELTVSLTTPKDPFWVATPAELQLVFEELPGRRLAYWHHAGNAARLDDLGAVPAEAWVDAAGDRLVGVTLEDWSRSGGGLPVGAGVVDWRALSRQLPASVPRVVAVDASLPAPLVLDALREAEGI